MLPLVAPQTPDLGEPPRKIQNNSNKKSTIFTNQQNKTYFPFVRTNSNIMIMQFSSVDSRAQHLYQWFLEPRFFTSRVQMAHKTDFNAYQIHTQYKLLPIRCISIDNLITHHTTLFTTFRINFILIVPIFHACLLS